MRKFNSHLQYYKIDLRFSIKLQEINFNACEEYKTKRDDRVTLKFTRDEDVPVKCAHSFASLKYKFMHNEIKKNSYL